ncbi:MAG TPA: UvrD-helicase domain-containing protein, partial [Jatrophihabitans sp.]|nr:UvrD-helicase domain-containing protein [Jatrophihabitans sp.]
MTLADKPERDRITHDTAATLFVNAGAGSGKTHALVERVAALVLTDGVRLANVAAVTFTEKAGAELRDRLRATFEGKAREAGTREAANEALDDLDGAAIGTLHAFAQRILAEHPIEAGLPPIIEVMDEVGSSVAFDERWAGLQTALLDDDSVAAPLLVALQLGMELKHVRSLALLLGNDWDLIDERVLVGPEPELRWPDIAAIVDDARRFVGELRHCRVEDDKLAARFDDVVEILTAYDEAVDDESRLGVVRQLGELKFGRIGRKENWLRPIDEIRTQGNDLAAAAKQLVDAVLDQCLRIITRWVARRVVEAAEIRRREGKLEFHDLLVLSRDLLRRDAGVRAALHDSYQRLLLDEFQDTDPIQIELAIRICAGADGAAADWRDIDVPDGRLFVVGDAKQSIYRFRRADIRNYLEAQAHVGEASSLTTNFRSVEPILGWVNHVFGTLITPSHGQQPEYVPLDGVRSETGSGAAVTVLGAAAHQDGLNAAALREHEARDVAAIIRQMLDEGWTVWDEQAEAWRPARRDDIAILVPARTSLPFLEDALDAAAVPYRAEASSLVYQAAEVRSLLAAARAVADASDA